MKTNYSIKQLSDKMYAVEQNGKRIPIYFVPKTDKALNNLKQAIKNDTFTIKAEGDASQLTWSNELPQNTTFKDGSEVELGDHSHIRNSTLDRSKVELNDKARISDSTIKHTSIDQGDNDKDLTIDNSELINSSLSANNSENDSFITHSKLKDSLFINETNIDNSTITDSVFNTANTIHSTIQQSRIKMAGLENTMSINTKLFGGFHKDSAYKDSNITLDNHIHSSLNTIEDSIINDQSVDTENPEKLANPDDDEVIYDPDSLTNSTFKNVNVQLKPDHDSFMIDSSDLENTVATGKSVVYDAVGIKGPDEKHPYVMIEPDENWRGAIGDNIKRRESDKELEAYDREATGNNFRQSHFRDTDNLGDLLGGSWSDWHIPESKEYNKLLKTQNRYDFEGRLSKVINDSFKYEKHPEKFVEPVGKNYKRFDQDFNAEREAYPDTTEMLNSKFEPKNQSSDDDYDLPF